MRTKPHSHQILISPSMEVPAKTPQINSTISSNSINTLNSTNASNSVKAGKTGFSNNVVGKKSVEDDVQAQNKRRLDFEKHPQKRNSESIVFQELLTQQSNGEENVLDEVDDLKIVQSFVNSMNLPHNHKKITFNKYYLKPN